MFVGCHDATVPVSGTQQSPQPCLEIPGGLSGIGQARDGNGQAGLDVHALGQGQWQADATDATRNPLSTKDLQQTIQDAAHMLQHQPEVITRFCSTQRLEADTKNALVPFLIDVSGRAGCFRFCINGHV